jgi:hypothetical protein
MGAKARLFWLRRFASHVFVVSCLVVTCCVGVGLGAAAGVLKLQDVFSSAASVRPPPSSPWGKDLKVARKSFPVNGSGSVEPWGREEIRWFVATYVKDLGPGQRMELVRAIHEECRIFGLAPQLVFSVMLVESEGSPTAESPKGAVGLMQINAAVGEIISQQVSLPWSGKESLFHPVTNVRLGIRYLFHMIQRYKDLDLGLTAYYLGPDRLDRMLTREEAVPQWYASRVLDRFRAM